MYVKFIKQNREMSAVCGLAALLVGLITVSDAVAIAPQERSPNSNFDLSDSASSDSPSVAPVAASASEKLLPQRSRLSTKKAEIFGDVIESAAANENAADEVEDPYAWLDGDIDCSKVDSAVKTRFPALNILLLRGSLLEEFRHIVSETCDTPRFSSCSFKWCDGNKSAVAKLDGIKPTASSTLNQPPVNNQITSGGLDNVGTGADRRASLSATSVVDANLVSDVDDFQSQAAKELVKLVEEKRAIQKRMFAQLQGREDGRGLTWQKVAVPGALRSARQSLRASGEPNPNSNPVRAANAQGMMYGRSLTPGLGGAPVSGTGAVGNAPTGGVFSGQQVQPGQNIPLSGGMPVVPRDAGYGNGNSSFDRILRDARASQGRANRELGKGN